MRLEVVFDFSNLRAVGLHHRVAAHAYRHTGDSRGEIFFSAGMAERTVNLLGDVLPVTECNRLRQVVLAGARNSYSATNPNEPPTH